MENYISDRLDPAIEWYDQESIKAQGKYKRLKYAELLLTAALPISSFIASDLWTIRLISISIGAFLSIFIGLQHIGNYQRHWAKYRRACELLKQEKYLYVSQASQYKNDNLAQLVTNVESIIRNENSDWLKTVQDTANHSSTGS